MLEAALAGGHRPTRASWDTRAVDRSWAAHRGFAAALGTVAAGMKSSSLVHGVFPVRMNLPGTGGAIENLSFLLGWLSLTSRKRYMKWDFSEQLAVQQLPVRL